MRSEKRRLNMLMSAVRPAKSLAAKLANLTADQQLTYRRWREQTGQWDQDLHGANAYERMLEGDAGPQLHRDVADALSGPAPVVTVDMTAADAMEAYRKYVMGD